jgi:pSer/pThr/pTyr-binding forkhead associated (FHA) protein
MSAAAILTISRNGETIKSYPIEGEALLGRSDGCVIRLEDRAISRQHAVFRIVGDGVQVEKKSEFAPMMVNGAECTRALLKEADVISIGPYLMKVTISKAGSAPAASALAPVVPIDVVGPLVPVNAGDTAPLDALESPNPQEKGPEARAADGPSFNHLEGAGDAGFEISEQPGAGAAGEFGNVGDGEGAGEHNGLELNGDLNAQPLQLDGPDGGAVGGGSSFAEPELESAHEDAKTKLSPATKLNVQLIFAPGAANVTEFEITKDEVSIGRGKNCDIVLNDKKASRKNAIIRRAGLKFSIKDLESANGTYVNGARVTEQELTGDDQIRIGDVEFQFKALSADYAAREKNFLSVPEEPSVEPNSLDLPFDMVAMENAHPDQPYEIAVPGAFDLSADPQGAIPGALPGLSPSASPGGAIPGITGIGPGDTKNMGLIDKIKNFKSLSTKDKVIVVAIFGGMLYFGLDMLEPEPAKKAPPKKAAVTATTEKAAPTFASLSPEKQRFVKAQHALAFDHYRNKEFDKTIYELGKIFELIPDYENSREIERYAKEGKRRVEAAEEEKRKKEEEERLKTKIQSLVEECRERMKHKDYEQARELFAQISVLDPDNAQVAAWKKEMEDFDEKRRLDEQTKQVQGEINKHAWEVYNEGVALKKQGRFHSAIAVLGKVGDIGASDKRVLALANKLIRECHFAIKSRRDPVLAEAKTQEAAGEFPKAFSLYQKATRIDPPHPEGYAGMARIRGILHDRAKLVYTEAVLAESYSDFELAKKKFKECREVAPADDVYHERATRKLGRYFRKEDAQ